MALLSHEGGGISSVTYGLGRSLSTKKIETAIFSTSTRRESGTEEINEYLRVTHLPMVDLPPRSFWFTLKNLDRLSRLLGDYDVIHGVSPEMASSYAWFGKHSKKPLVTTLHGSSRAALEAFIHSSVRNWVLSDFAFNVLELPLHDMTTKTCMSKSDEVVVCSFTTLAELRDYEKIDASKVSVIYNGVDLDEIQQGTEEGVSNEEDKEYEYSLMYAGRLFWMKGISFALRAYLNLRSQFKDLHLKIFGKGPMESEIKRFVASQGLKDYVHFGDFLPHRELISEIKKSDAVVFPSLYESQPMFALETMACKKPLIAFDLPYAREIIKSGHNGLLARTGDVEDLSSKIALTLCDADFSSKLGENAYQYIKRNHDWGTQADKYLKVYSKVTNKHDVLSSST